MITITLVKQGNHFVYKGYNKKIQTETDRIHETAHSRLSGSLDNQPEHFPGFERLSAENMQNMKTKASLFDKMTEDLKNCPLALFPQLSGIQKMKKKYA